MLLSTLFPLLFTSILALGEVHIDDKTVNQIENSSMLCSCSSYVVFHRPDVPLRNAYEYHATTTEPTVGAIALMHYPSNNVWHVALVIGVGDDWVRISETNYESCKQGERTIPKTYSRLIGYF